MNAAQRCVTAWLLAGAAFCAHAQAEASALRVAEVAPGVYVHAGKLEDWLPANGGDVANLGFVVGSRCVAVIDAGGTPEVGRALRAAVRQHTPLPVCYVIDTHAHPDHVLGNVAFRGPGTQFVGHAKLAAALSARAPFYLNALRRDFELTLPPADVVYPDITVDKRLELDLGGRVLQLDAWATAHTDHDLTVYDRSTRTLFLSDLLFVQHIPVLDGSLRGWLGVLGELRGFDVAVAVPGHGPVSREWPSALEAQRDYLADLLAQTRAAIKARRGIQQAVEQIGVPAGQRWLLAERFHRRNVTAAYAELEWEE